MDFLMRRIAIARTQGFMGVNGVDWLQGTYQLANRFAFLYFLNQIAKVPTFLVLINFVNDQSNKPTPLFVWRRHYQNIFSSMGLHAETQLLDHVILLYPEAPSTKGGSI